LDNVGNRLQITSATGGVTRYGYDQLYRLTSWTTPTGQVTQYIYDAAGNRTSVISPAGATNYTYDAADEMLTAGGLTFAYDRNGSLIQKTTPTAINNYSWDALNRLVSVSGNDINTRYAYDGDGNRVQQQIRAGTYQYLNDVVTSLPVVLREGRPDGNIEYVHGQSIISESISSQQYFYQFDGLGSAVNVTDQNGALQANYGYDPWGQAINPPDPPTGLDLLGTNNTFKFTGEALDNSGLVYLRARYYDASIGRFLSRDNQPGTPLVPQILNTYDYVINNPLRFVDPSGETPESTGMVLGTSITDNPFLLYNSNPPNSASTPPSLLTVPNNSIDLKKSCINAVLDAAPKRFTGVATVAAIGLDVADIWKNGWNLRNTAYLIQDPSLAFLGYVYKPINLVVFGWDLLGCISK
jgi:RHS repeat-associated protein